LTKELHKAGFYNHVFQLDFGDKVVDVLARDVQFHPVTDVPLHVDFLRIQADSKVTVSIPLHFINHDKSPALKQGGLLNIVVHALELSVPAHAIPETLVVDLEGLSMGEAIHLSHLKLPSEWRAVHADRDDTLATIVAPSGLSDETTQAS
jgi:large subunit ribosomal protein L25